MDFAGSGAAALQKLEALPVDVVVSDMRMPLMNGGQLLRRVREGWPGTVRIILSGHAEQEAALRTLEVAHRFLSKPCESGALIEVIDRAVHLRQLLSDAALRDVVGRIGSLTVAPQVAERLDRLLAENQGTDEIVAMIEREPGLAAKTLQIANCALSGAGQAVTSVADAVARVGPARLRSLGLTETTCGHGEFARIDAPRLRAVRASWLASEISAEYAPRETARTTALLAEVGCLVPELGSPSESGDRESAPDYAAVGAYLLHMWGLPQAITETVAHHRHPARAQHERFDTLGVVHVAVALSRGEQPDEGYLRAMGVADQLPRWTALSEAGPREVGQ